MARLEDFVSANHERPTYVEEICATGVSERTLRVCCNEHLGMGPVCYLWLRRMHVARKVLLRTDPAAVTVTEIARPRLWELGRFSVQYWVPFGGERPAASPKSSSRYAVFLNLHSRLR